MARKRKLNANLSDDPVEEQAEAANSRGGMGGMWAGSAMNMLKQRIEDAHGTLVQGILSGTVALELDPAQIKDAVGSDRVAGWQEDEDFQQLVANIKRRGQTQPIRVRPSGDEWAPNDDNPLKTKEFFEIQSGRRRLEACRVLGQPVRAIIATKEADALQADLEERFHENTMRRALNGFEELLSIGALATGLQNLTQVEIAERLGVPQGDVSLGLACLEHRDAIIAEVDVAATPKRQYRSILPKIKRGEPLEPTLPPALTGEKSQPFDVRGIPMTAKKGALGYAVNIRKARVKDDDLEKMLVDIAKVVMKYQIKK